MSNFYISRSHRRSSVDVKMLLKTLSILVNLICPQISRVALKLYEKFSNIINRLNIFRKETFWNNLSECCNTSQCQSDMVKYELRVAGYELRVTSLTARVESLKAHELKFKSTSSNPWVSSSNLRVTSSNPRVTSSNPRITSSNPRIIKSMKTQVSSLKSSSFLKVASPKFFGNL